MDILNEPAENSATHSAAAVTLRPEPIEKIAAAATETATAASHNNRGTSKREEKTMPTASGTTTATIGIIPKCLRMLPEENSIR